ncbi:MAG: HDOD domain-containing protein [Armatimonadetes bacterium]|nr:HDOD domain-containing protein [Armatimonadota bacterium]
MLGKSARKTVLIVSDVPYSRLLLKQTITKQGSDVVTANSTAEGLKKLEEQSFDLVVVDLSGSDAAGEHMLLQIRVTGASLPALLLSSSLDRDMVRRMSNLRPVGFLTKPLHMESLLELLPLAVKDDPSLLRRSTELSKFRPTADPTEVRQTTEKKPFNADELLQESKIDEHRLQRMFGSLPLMPHVVARIIQLSQDDAGTVKELADVISSDPRLCSQLLRIVNSAYFGFARRIATVPEATVILGTQAIRNLTLGAAVAGFFGGRSKVLNRQLLWRHSLAVGTASRKMAEKAGSGNAEEAFTAGLLHDFGRVALERHMSEHYATALELCRSSGRSLLQAEQEALGFNHAWLSGWLAEKWNLPPVLSQAMAWHHQPESALETYRMVAVAVNVGDVLCHLGGLGGVEEVPPTTEPSVYAMGIMAVDQQEADQLLPDIIAETETLERQLSAAIQG